MLRHSFPRGPTLGNGVNIGANAVLIGKIEIGDGATIGPNAVVTMNVPAGATVFAPPPGSFPPLRTRD